MNFEVLKMGFKAYLEEEGKLKSGDANSSSNDISIFMYANDFKTYLQSELSVNTAELQSKSISDILKMEITADNKLVDPEELEAYDNALSNNGETEEVENDETAQTNVSETSTENAAVTSETNSQEVTDLNAENPEITQEELNQNEDIVTQMINDLLQDDIFVQALDTNGSGKIEDEELDAFLGAITGNDENADDLSVDDLLQALIIDDVDVRTEEEKEAEELALKQEEEISKAKNLKTKNANGENIRTRQSSNAVSGAGSGGSYDSYGNFINNTDEVTLENMSKDELEEEKTKAESDLSSAQNDYNSTVDEQADLVENAYNDYQDALKEIDDEDKELAEEVSNLNEQIYEQEKVVDEQDKIIDEQDNIISDSESRISAAETQITSLNGLLSELEEKNGQDDGNGGTLDYSSQIANVKSQIEAAENEKKSAEEVKTKAEEAKTEAQDAKKEAEDTIKDLETQLEELETQLFENHPELQELKNNYQEAKETKTTEVDNAKSAVTEAQEYLNEVNTAITNYDTKETINKNTPDGMTESVKSAIETAFSQLGIYEDAGDNRGTMEKYGAGAGNPWCAAFVSWVYGQTDNNPLTYTASVAGLKSQAVSAGYYSSAKSYTPVAGDIMIQQENGASHTGIVVACDDEYVYTIEGNSSDAVRQRRYSLSDYSKISGYIRMNEWTGGSSNVDSTTYLASTTDSDLTKYNKTS